MVAQFPDTSSESVELRLNPKITFSIVTQDLSSSGLDQPNLRKARIAEIRINATNLEKNLVVTSVSRIFNHIYNTITNDINPDISNAIDTIHSGDSVLLTSASVSLTIDVNKTSLPPLVNFNLQVNNLKSQYVDDTFSRIKTYLLDAIETDMNPNP